MVVRRTTSVVVLLGEIQLLLMFRQGFSVQSALQDGFNPFVSMHSQQQCAATGSFMAFFTIGFAQAQDTQTCGSPGVDGVEMKNGGNNVFSRVAGSLRPGYEAIR